MSENRKNSEPGPEGEGVVDVEHFRPRHVHHWIGEPYAVSPTTLDLMKVLRENSALLSPEDHEKFVKATIAEFSLDDSAAEPIPAFDAGGIVPAPAEAREITPPPAPPSAGEALVGLFCRREIREAVLGDLDEKFAELAERRGARVAKAWYWSQAARSALFFAVRWGRRLLELEAILRRVF